MSPSEAETAVVRTETREGVATITLDRPDVLNAMNFALMEQLAAALDAAADDADVRVVVLAGAGRAFCSGADLGNVEGSIEEGPGGEPDTVMNDVYHPAIRRLASMPVPTLARVHGVVAGGGLGLALGCDLAIAAHSADFVCTFGPKLGIVPDLGTSWHLPRRVGRARALGMALLGDRISAAQAAEWGLIWAAVPDDELDDTAAAIVARLKQSSGECARRTRALIDDAPGRTLSEQLDVEAAAQQVLIPRNMYRAAEAFLAKKDPEFER